MTEVQMIGVVVDGRAANRKEGRLMESFATSLIKTTKVKTLYGLKGVPTKIHECSTRRVEGSNE